MISRRSGGLSIGINLFPRRKVCNFDCPYCEVLPSDFRPGPDFSPAALSAELGETLARLARQGGTGSRGSDSDGIRVRDLCISGNGEPTLSPWLGEALEIAGEARDRFLGGREGGVGIVLITNSTGFSRPDTAALLSDAVRRLGLGIWAKLDGADPEWFGLMSRSDLRLQDVADPLESFALRDPVIVQTMLCGLASHAGGRNRFIPGEDRIRALASLIAGMAGRGARISGLQLYTKARPDAAGITFPLSDAEMSRVGALAASLVPFPVRVFGERGETALR